MMRLLAEHGADPHFVHRVRYVGTAGSFGSEWKEEATTTLMAAAGMGGVRGLAFVEPNPSDLPGLALEAARIALELGVDRDAVDLEGRTALEGSRYEAIAELLGGPSAAR
jgi:hypothetical protein